MNELGSATDLEQAAGHLMISERISGLPVVDDAGLLVGIITVADFLRAIGAPAHQPHHNLWQPLDSLFSHLTHHGEPEAPYAPVTEHMVKNVVCVQPEQDVHEVIEMMKQNSVKRVVVCDSELSGTRHDHTFGPGANFLRPLYPAAPGLSCRAAPAGRPAPSISPRPSLDTGARDRSAGHPGPITAPGSDRKSTVRRVFD
ncbi:MAG TPA: CBS domain-containing protein [Gammaproteobacteria bacterium]|nr:CBS domain-containing protein [Gammaproteobacteria bacterium]